MPHRAYLGPYRQSHAQHGPAFEVTCWASRKSQELRFKVFTQMGVLAGRRILDAGCSRGDFAEYLLRHDIRFARYIGVDALAEVIEYARQREIFQGQECAFHCGDFVADPKMLALDKPEIICLSGTLNTMPDDLALRVLDAAWQAAGQVFIFNFLSTRCSSQAPRQAPPVRRFDPLPMLDWALQRTSQVRFRQDYFPNGHDATIAMEKQG